MSNFFIYLLLVFSASLHASDADTISNRKKHIISLAKLDYGKPLSRKITSYDVLANTAKFGCVDKKWSSYIVSLTDDYNNIDIFSLPALVRYLYQFDTCLSNNQKAEIQKNLTKIKVDLLNHGTLNHAILWSSSYLLLAEYFPNLTWSDNHGNYYSSQELFLLLKKLLTSRAKKIMVDGHFEQLSPTYPLVNFFPLLNILDFTKDSGLKNIIDKEANKELEILRIHSFFGVLVPPITRINYDQINSSRHTKNYVPSITQQLLWFYFGEPSGLRAYDFNSRKEPSFLIVLALSKWKHGVESKYKFPYFSKTITPAFGYWGNETSDLLFADSYFTENYAVGSGNQKFNPFGYSGYIQTFAISLRSNKEDNQIECFHPYWESNKGEDYWGASRSSPFQQTYRYNKSSVVMLFDVPQKDPWTTQIKNRFFNERNEKSNKLLQLVSCRMPNNLDQIVKEDNWLFLREGKTYVAIATLKGFNLYNDAPSSLTSKFLVLKIREPKTALFFRVETETKSQNFEQFMKKVRNQKPNYDVNYDSVSIEELSGVKTSVKFNLKKINQNEWSSIPIVIKNGIVTNPDDSYVIQSRSVNLKNGILTIH